MDASEENNPNVPAERTPQGWQQYWTREITAANKRLRTFRKRGNRICDRFQGLANPNTSGEGLRESDSNGATLLNLFHSNIITKQSMLCGQKPKTDVSREFDDPNDDVARVAAFILQRMLDSDNAPSGKDLKTQLSRALQDRLLPGLGVARIRYDYGAQEVPVPNMMTGETEMVEQIVWEDAPIDHIFWRDFAWGWCRSWDELPWIAFRSYVDKDEARKRWPKEYTNLDYKSQSPKGDKESEGSDMADPIQKAEVWEIWCKYTHKVYFYSKGATGILESLDDPLQLTNFWPVPKCLFANLTTTLLEPVADFMLAQDLYNEIDRLQTRISMITNAIKVVGVYDKGAGDSVGRMLTEAQENELIPVDNWALFAEKGGLKGVIQWFPVESVVGVLATLQDVRDQTIQLLYEVTGMSDILRGANTDQYTSDGTNKMKAKFGSVRIQALQDDFSRFASELQALKAEVISKHFTDRSIMVQANTRFLPEADQQLVPQALQLIHSPDIRWRTQIRPESIAMIDQAQSQSERIEFLNTMGTFVQSAQAMAKAVPESLPMLISMIKWGMAGFKGAESLEGTMDRALDAATQTAQQGGENNAEGIKLQIEQMKMQQAQIKAQGELQKLQLKQQGDMAALQAKFKGEIQKILVDSEADVKLENLTSFNEANNTMREHELTMQEILASLQADLQREEMQSSMAIAEEEVEHRNTMTQMEYQNRATNTGSD